MNFINLSLTNKPYEQAVNDAIQRVLASGRFIGGPEVKQFEEAFAKYLGVKYVISCASGTDALYLSYKALGIGPGDEVIVPSFTYVATASMVVECGATPVFCDVDENTFNIDIASARSKITSKTKAIVPVHMFGQAANMNEVMIFAQEHNLFVIEDCAQSAGATFNGQQTGNIGTTGCFSFFPTKNLGCYGDGGAISTNDDALAEKILLLKSQGQKKKYLHECIGYNSRLDSLQAAILSAKLPYLDEEITARQKQAEKYDQQFVDVENVDSPAVLEHATHTYNQYTLRVKNREVFKTEQEEKGIPTMIYYPTPLHLQPCFADLGYVEGDLPVSEQLCREVLSLPVFF